jgi:hypothetical protein
MWLAISADVLGIGILICATFVARGRTLLGKFLTFAMAVPGISFLIAVHMIASM